MSDASTEGNARTKKAQKSVSDEMKRDKEIKKSQFLVAFGEQLNLELDAIGFVDGRRRSGALAARFDIDRSNGYRILNGVGNPDALYLSKVRTLGVSVDRILDNIAERAPQTYTVSIGGRLVSATVQCGVKGRACSAAILPKDGFFELIVVLPGEALSEGAIPIQSIQFIEKPTLAIVEDDLPTLNQLADQLFDAFRPVKFDSAHALIDALQKAHNFNAILMDWRLPDMDGEQLIKEIREHSKVPICILTKDVTASKAIARAFANGNVDHVSKPAEPDILAARIQMAIKNSGLFA